MTTKQLKTKPKPFRNLSANIMTPTIMGYYSLGDGGYAELSMGEGLNRNTVYGVTVRPDRLGRSKLFHSLGEAEAYIDAMGGLAKTATEGV